MKLVWFRNDLRTGDHSALYAACKNNAGEGVLAVAAITPSQWFLQDESKSRVQFWLANLQSLSQQLSTLNIPLKIIAVERNAELPVAFLKLAREHGVRELYFNIEYPEYEQRRDSRVTALLQKQGVRCHSFESDLILPPGSVLNQKGDAYRVFTPFSRAWKKHYLQQLPSPLPVSPVQPVTSITSDKVPKQINYANTVGADWNIDLWPSGEDAARRQLLNFVDEKFGGYKEQRDLPGIAGTSVLSPYFSVGVLSARQCLAAIQSYSDDPEWFDNQWVTEVIWREFYRHLLVLFPELNRWQPFKPEIEEKIPWQNNSELFAAWCQGETGFAIVDAGMKQLLTTGWMHNRVRMVTASFLTKLLRQDWRAGAEFFMQHLIDGDFASNLGGWQWSASVGADAAPYFRIFNPMRQAERFDAAGDYVSYWLPELKGLTAVQQHDPLLSVARGRPAPLIDYRQARASSIEAFHQS
ncbi:MAG: deoxyribodipyrimidine photo-lyase [Neptuniibacter sp.]